MYKASWEYLSGRGDPGLSVMEIRRTQIGVFGTVGDVPERLPKKVMSGPHIIGAGAYKMIRDQIPEG